MINRKYGNVVICCMSISKFVKFIKEEIKKR